MNGTSTRLFKAQTASSLLTPGKTFTHATAPMHGVLPTILPFGKVTKALPLLEGVPRRGEGVVTSTLFFTEERSDEASRYHKVDVIEILRYALDDKVMISRDKACLVLIANSSFAIKGQGTPCPYMINSVPLRQHKQFIRMVK